MREYVIGIILKQQGNSIPKNDFAIGGIRCKRRHLYNEAFIVKDHMNFLPRVDVQWRVSIARWREEGWPSPSPAAWLQQTAMAPGEKEEHIFNLNSFNEKGNALPSRLLKINIGLHPKGISG